ncbi:hypothetical protein CLV25_101505 [Acetobacteroides hydrogenigenes]|uniref:Uncharacterized protein n=1 Tax=Acetobacteroides hydrogenigenes TaxID=979970 RepID=A0A4R2F045_9BACT|nr:hypothetical protein CLV25_101505 [Acetobacteroides hydrogenigenes]
MLKKEEVMASKFQCNLLEDRIMLGVVKGGLLKLQGKDFHSPLR